MNKKYTFLFLIGFLVVGVLSWGNVEAVGCPNGMAGDGDENPCQITSWENLDSIRKGLNLNYILMNDLDLYGATRDGGDSWNDGAGFEPIGGYANNFTGSFDGNDYIISGLYINRPAEDDIGLFGVNIGAISNVGLIDVTVIGTGNRVGGLVGLNQGGTITNSYSIGVVTGGRDVGGLVGYTELGDITNSYANVTVTGTGDFVGGLVGLNSGLYGGGTITNSYSEGDVKGTNFVGGLVGSNSEDGTITNSYSEGDVEGNDRVGGLVGSNWQSTITNSYSIGVVTGGSDVGGLVGNNNGTGAAITNSYATGKVIGINGDVGGLVGYNAVDITNSYARGDVTGNHAHTLVGGFVGTHYSGTIKNSYSTGKPVNKGAGAAGGFCGTLTGTETGSFWDTEISETGDSNGGTGKTTAEMKNINTFTDAETEGLNEAWSMETSRENLNNGYPHLAWQENGNSPIWYIYTTSSSRARPIVYYDISFKVTPEEAGSVPFSSGSYSQGTRMTFTAQSNEGYVFSHWEEGGEIISESLYHSLTVTKDKELTAVFEVEKTEEDIEEIEETDEEESEDIEDTEETEETMISCQVPIYLTRLVSFGANNNPEDVKLLQRFLNTYEGYNLPVTGIYSATDKNAVIEWQEKYAEDILAPWGITEGTGYVFTTSLRKIKEIHEAMCIDEVIETPKAEEQDQITYQFTRNLSVGMTGEDVKELQQYLNNNGFPLAQTGVGSLGNETNYFGSLTQQALINFQRANNINPAVGYFGPITRGFVNR